MYFLTTRARQFHAVYVKKKKNPGFSISVKEGLTGIPVQGEGTQRINLLPSWETGAEASDKIAGLAGFAENAVLA